MEQLPDDVEIEPDEQTDAFTVSFACWPPFTHIWESVVHFSFYQNSRLLMHNEQPQICVACLCRVVLVKQINVTF